MKVVWFAWIQERKKIWISGSEHWFRCEEVEGLSPGWEGGRGKENVNGKELPHEGEGLKTQMWLMLGKDMEGLRRMRLLQMFWMRKGLVLTTVCQVEVVEIGLWAWKSKSGP